MSETKLNNELISNNNKRIVVSMKRNRLTLLGADGKKIKEFPIIYGRNSAEGTKEIEGDQKTPRGKYYICYINEQSQFTLFFGLSYPGNIDGVKGYAKGLVNLDELTEIFLTNRLKQKPPWYTKLGGEIGIHGGGIDRDGTRGCIAMKDEDVIELGSHIFKGMEVEIN
ncbi:MAG: L,D-transpeptidase [Firmicutes bacterium]|nr:L,D-transpeptidase [Bacillota bacterium]